MDTLTQPVTDSANPLPEPSVASSLPAPRIRFADRAAEVVRPQCIDELVGPDHPVRIIWEYVKDLDLSVLYNLVKSIEGHPGRPAIDARILFAVWLYATIDGETSARRVSNFCSNYNPYMWLCGGISINYHTLSDFYTDHAAFLDQQFTLHIASLISQGLIDLSTVAQDGMRVRASAGAASFHGKESLDEALAEAEAHIAKLAKERAENPQVVDKRKQAAQERAARERHERIIEAQRQLPEVEAKKTEKDRKKARVSTTDPDARVMKMGDGGFRPAFNVELATETAHQIIVGFDVVNEGTDHHELTPMLEQIHERTEQYPEKALVDGGFVNQATIDHCAEKQIVFYGPVPKPKNEARDRYEPMPDDSPAVAEWRKRMNTNKAKEIYKERASTAECVNAIARLRGLQQFTVRGLKKAKAAIQWFALAHNIMREAALRPATA